MGERSTIFIVKETGSAAFCLPLWLEWAQRGSVQNWGLVLDNAALRVTAPYECLKPHIVAPWGELDKLAAISGVRAVISSATGDPFEVGAGMWARSRKAKHIQFLDVAYDTQKRINLSNPPSSFPDLLLVIHEEVKNAAIKAGMSEQNVKVVGHPAWLKTLHQGIKPGPMHTVLFAAQPISEISSLRDLGYDEIKVWQLLCQAQSLFPEIIKNLIYCPHPAQTNGPLDFPPNARLLQKQERVLEAGGIMVSMFASNMMDAFMSGHKVVSWQPGLKQEDRCFLSRAGYIPLIKSSKPEDLMKAILNYPVVTKGIFELKKWLEESGSLFEKSILEVSVF